MVWGVVKFTSENSVEVVPLKWFVRNTRECFWPPAHTKKSKIIDFIRNRYDPDTDWKTFPAVLMAEYGDYNTAQRKASKAQDTDDLTSTSESLVKGRGYRKPCRNRRYESDSSSQDESPDDNTYPTITEELIDNVRSSPLISSVQNANGVVSKGNMKGTCGIQDTSSTINFSESQSQLVNNQSQQKISEGDVERSSSNINSQGSSRQIEIPTDRDFKRIILADISLINLKLNTILDRIDALTKVRQIETEWPITDRDHVSEILCLFPLQSEENLNKLEDWLKDKGNQKLLINELSRIGGQSISQVTRKIMYRTLSNEIGMLYSWEGAKKKRTFKNLGLSVIILESVRKCVINCSETEVINIIKLWLVRSKDRLQNSTKPQDLKKASEANLINDVEVVAAENGQEP